MKKMMFLTLALSVMAMGGVYANDSMADNARKPAKVKVEVNYICDDHHNHSVTLFDIFRGHRRPHCPICDKPYRHDKPDPRHSHKCRPPHGNRHDGRPGNGMHGGHGKHDGRPGAGMHNGHGRPDGHGIPGSHDRPNGGRPGGRR